MAQLKIRDLYNLLSQAPRRRDLEQDGIRLVYDGTAVNLSTADAPDTVIARVPDGSSRPSPGGRAVGEGRTERRTDAAHGARRRITSVSAAATRSATMTAPPAASR